MLNVVEVFGAYKVYSDKNDSLKTAILPECFTIINRNKLDVIMQADKLR